ncbi:uncharacterized protein LOC112566267 [Pomacea canaliculata]|uniref:uncharacterized protein LOC112566267 n=1 Tax=Pomacea canaliculata TaxID=400727 RepID=UPI000D737BF9|nr:uncharacterized protein LOC112566267 [Pomacea canaliculata]
MKILWILAVTIATVTHLWQSSFALLTTPLWKDLVDDLPVLPLPEDFSSPEDHHDKRSICTMSSCGGTKNVTLYKEVARYYKRLFYSTHDIFRLNCEANPWKCMRLSEKGALSLINPTTLGNSDFDQCCRTIRVFQTYSGTMTTSTGVQCNVLTLNNSFQVVHVGTCDTSSANGCSGTCRQEMSKVSLLCVRGGSVEFNLFDVPSYCSCKAG